MYFLLVIFPFGFPATFCRRRILFKKGPESKSFQDLPCHTKPSKPNYLYHFSLEYQYINLFTGALMIYCRAM